MFSGDKQYYRFEEPQAATVPGAKNPSTAPRLAGVGVENLR